MFKESRDLATFTRGLSASFPRWETGEGKVNGGGNHQSKRVKLNKGGLIHGLRGVKVSVKWNIEVEGRITKFPLGITLCKRDNRPDQPDQRHEENFWRSACARRAIASRLSRRVFLLAKRATIAA